MGDDLPPNLDVSRETIDRLHAFAELLLVENDQQNLISRASLDHLWERHIVDSAQLLMVAPKDAAWVDVGAGAGLPGIVLAIMGVRSITLVEPRKLRAEFLQRCVSHLDLESSVSVAPTSVAAVRGPFDIITARAVASLDKFLGMAVHLASPTSQWVLPKGRNGSKELADAELRWQGRFRTVASYTDPESVIVLASNVRAKRRERA